MVFFPIPVDDRYTDKNHEDVKYIDTGEQNSMAIKEDVVSGYGVGLLIISRYYSGCAL